MSTDGIVVRPCQLLLEHLQTYQVDGASVASALFREGRLWYPSRWEVEDLMQAPDPYTLGHEARVISGLPAPVVSSINLLSWQATQRHAHRDPTLELLWLSHGSLVSPLGPSLDRLVAALVTVEELTEGLWWDDAAYEAMEVLVDGLNRLGFPPTRAALEEIFDGADPACVGLGLVEL